MKKLLINRIVYKIIIFCFVFVLFFLGILDYYDIGDKLLQVIKRLLRYKSVLRQDTGQERQAP